MAFRKFQAKNNTKNTKFVFDERGKYRNEAVPQRYLNRHPGLFRDFWFIENMYYGRIDQNHRFLTLKPEKLTALGGQDGASIFLVDFFSHAVSDFLAEHRKAFSSSKIQKNDEFLSEINPFKGHVRLLTDFELHMKRLRDRVNSKMVRAANTIEDFDDFIDFFLREIYNGDEITPITLTGFIASRLSSPLSTGLFLDLIEIDSGDDQTKISSFIDRPNYEFLMRNCIKHGFMIDYNIPTRLCANLGSFEMNSYMKLYGSSFESVFEDYYEQSYPLDHIYFMDYMRKFYNRFVGLRPNIKKEKTIDQKNKKVFRFNIKRQRISQYELETKYGESYRLELYCKLRNYETAQRYSDSLLDVIISNSKRILNDQGLDASLSYINDEFIGFLNDPYAYNGFTYSQQNKENTTGQKTSELLRRSVADSRKTFY